MNLPAALETGPGMAGLLVTILGALWFLVRRKLSSDTTGNSVDHAVREQLARMTEENIRLSADLKEERRLHKATHAELHQYMRELYDAMSKLQPSQRDELPTDFAALGDIVERIEPK